MWTTLLHWHLIFIIRFNISLTYLCQYFKNNFIDFLTEINLSNLNYHKHCLGFLSIQLIIHITLHLNLFYWKYQRKHACVAVMYKFGQIQKVAFGLDITAHKTLIYLFLDGPL